MKIYVGHSNLFDYQKELYDPIKKSNLIIENDVFFPHNEKNKIIPTKDIIKNSDLFIAEVSYPATGLGIELGFASDAEVEILCIYKKGTKPSSSLKFITDNFICYENEKDLIDRITQYLKTKI